MTQGLLPGAYGCPLVTHDERIVRFARRRGRQYGFATAG